MPNQFLSDEFGDIEDYFVTDYWLIDNFVGDTLWGWGLQNAGRLGEGTSGNSGGIVVPVTTFAGGTNWKQVMSDKRSVGAAVKTDGTLWIWGWNTEGELGVNDISPIRPTPVTTFAGGNNWKSVAGGYAFTAAIKTDGTLWTWGRNAFGTLGINNTTNRSTPVTTFAGGNNWKSVACGAFHTVAIKTDGSLWTWGNNGYGQLGANLGNVNIPTPITTFAGGNTWKSVTCGKNHTAAIKTDGSLWTWGFGTSAQLGDNNIINRSTPVTTFAGGNNWKSVGSGWTHTAAIKTDGSLWTWGVNSFGQLGTNDTANRTTPVTTFAGGNNWKQVAGGNGNTAAIKTDGTLWTWGNGGEGRLGTNNTTSRSTPVTTFAGGNNWKQVSCGENHVAAIKSGLNVDLSFSGLFVVPEYETLTYTLSSANLTITGNGTNTVNVYKNANGSGWNEQIYSLVPFTAPCTIEYNKQAASDLMIGWNEDPLTNADYVSLDYASYTNNTGSYQVYHNSIAQNPGGTWSTADKLYIVYNTDGTIKHYTGSKLLFSTANYGTGKTVYVDTTFYGVTTNGFANLKVIRAAWNGTAYGA